MGKKRARTVLRNENNVEISSPPGFVSLTSFQLKRASVEETCSSMASTSLSKSEDQNDFDLSEADSDQIDMELPSRICLPKGVTHGCSDCSNCLKVKARWRPDDARKNTLQEAPIFNPTEEDFKDTLKFISSISPKAEGYGICRILPPPSWRPPCVIKENNIWETCSFASQNQRVDGLEKQYVGRRNHTTLVNHGVSNGITVNPEEVGSSNIEGFDPGRGPEFTPETFKEFADDFKGQYFSSRNNSVDSNADAGECQNQWGPTVEDIEGEYRRIVESPTEEIEVLYRDDLDSSAFGSGFPTKSNSQEMSDCDEYLNSGWNLNNTPRLPGSLLSFEDPKTSRLLVPQLKFGMCFSSFGWQIEEHHLYSLSYLHLGGPKIWYGIPGRYAFNFQAVMRKFLLQVLVEQPKRHDRLLARLPLSILRSNGIPVYRCIQYPGEFVLVLPGAYYSGFDCGFSCTETVNVAPLEWLLHGQNIVELYRGWGRRTSISHDKILLGAAGEAVKAQWEISILRNETLDNLRWKNICGKDGILARALKSRMRLEHNRREYLCASSQSRKMDINFDAVSKRECSICYYDLHLSAAQCVCSPDRYTCLLHAQQLCSCPWSEKIFLYRYEISELNNLIEALEGKLSEVYRWTRDHLKLNMRSYVPGDSSLSPKKRGGGVGIHQKESELKQQRTQQASESCGIGSAISSIDESKSLDEVMER